MFFLSIVANSLNRTTRQRLFTGSYFVFSFRLFENERVAVLIRASEIFGRSIPANITIDAGGIYVVPSWNVLLDSIVFLRHGLEGLLLSDPPISHMLLVEAPHG